MSAAVKSPNGQPRHLFSRQTWGWILVGVALLVAALFAASRWIEIVEGLSPGDTVVTKAGAFVRDGDKINPVPAATN